jgi:hypothetical protein
MEEMLSLVVAELLLLVLKLALGSSSVAVGTLISAVVLLIPSTS